MSARPDEGARRWLKRAARDAERAEVAARLRRVGLGEGRLATLIDDVERALGEAGCDHSRRHTEGWLELHGIELALALDVLSSMGGRCDCMIVMNVRVPADHADATEPDAAPPTERPPPPPRRIATPRPTDHADDVLRWDFPSKPWRVGQAAPDALVTLRFGKGLVLSLLDGAPLDPADDEAWCWARWERSPMMRNDMERARDWRRRFSYTARTHDAPLLGPGLAGRRWRIGATGRTNVMLWVILDVAAPRTLEVETEVQREGGDLRAVAEALGSLRRA